MKEKGDRARVRSERAALVAEMCSLTDTRCCPPLVWRPVWFVVTGQVHADDDQTGAFCVG